MTCTYPCKFLEHKLIFLFLFNIIVSYIDADICDMPIKFADNINLGKVGNLLKSKKTNSLTGFNITFYHNIPQITCELLTIYINCINSSNLKLISSIYLTVNFVLFCFFFLSWIFTQGIMTQKTSQVVLFWIKMKITPSLGEWWWWWRGQVFTLEFWGLGAEEQSEVGLSGRFICF